MPGIKNCIGSIKLRLIFSKSYDLPNNGRFFFFFNFLDSISVIDILWKFQVSISVNLNVLTVNKISLYLKNLVYSRYI